MLRSKDRCAPEAGCVRDAERVNRALCTTAQLRSEPDLRLEKTITQGIEMGRPSRLAASADKNAGTVTATYIGGTCMPMMQGVLDLT
jgi:predicted PhzF superfamily epimerase YddE/YHI9